MWVRIRGSVATRAICGALALFLCLGLVSGPLGQTALAATGTIDDPVEWDDIDQLGNWTDYNGLIFEDMTAHQADSEGALAVGGDADLAITGGYDIGASYDYEETTQMGQYVNPGNALPTFLLGGNVNVHWDEQWSNVHGGPIVMTEAALAEHRSAETQLHLGQDTGDGWVVMKEEIINTWFSGQRQQIDSLSEGMLDATVTEIDISEFSDKSYIENDINDYVNQTLTYNGEVDNKILIVTVRSEESIVFGETGYYKLPVPAEWVYDYDLIIYNFPDAEEITIEGDPQTIVGGETYNKTHPDAHIPSKAVAERNAVCSSVVYHFPAAESIDSTGIFILGSIIAPNARLYADGGSINGRLVCRTFETENSMELHSFYINKKIYDLESGGGVTGNIQLSKYLAYGGRRTTHPLEGAEYVLLREEDSAYFDGAGGFTTDPDGAAVYTTGADGGLTISGVPPGDYIVREITPPEGYVLNDTDSSDGDTYRDCPVTVDEKGQGDSVVRYNAPECTDVWLKKVSGDAGGEGLAGAVFDLVREADEIYPDNWVLLQNATSGDDGLLCLEGLPRGTYRLVETASPDGHRILEENIVFTVDYVDGALATLDGLGDSPDNPIAVVNERVTPDNLITIYKYDETDESAGGLEGAAFELYRREGDQWVLVEQNDPEDSEIQPSDIDIVTDSDGYYRITHLPVGEYRMVETVAPEGYSLKNEHNDPDFGDYALAFTVDDGEDIYPLTIGNERKLADLELLKVDGGGEPLRDVGFLLEMLSDSIWSPVGDTVYTDGDGLLPFTDLPEGEYRLTETSPPPGSSGLADAVYFRLEIDHEGVATVTLTDPDGDTVTLTHRDGESPLLTVVNDVATVDLTLKKVDMGDMETPLAGARFGLYTCDGGHGAGEGHDDTAPGGCWGDTPVAEATSGADGLLSFTGLTSGEYRLVELAAPTGYQLPAGQWRLVVDAEKGTFAIEAVDSGGVPAVIETDGGDEAAFLVPNQEMYTLPLTGGSGWIRFLLTGAGLILGGLAAMGIGRRRGRRHTAGE